MVISDFKKLVADYMNRGAVLFDADDPTKVDKLLLAANNAKVAAQRKLLFELARMTVDLTVDKANGGDLSTIVDHVSGSPVRVQTLERGFLPDSTGTSLIPVDIINRDAQIRSVKRRTENLYDPKKSTLPSSPQYPQLVRQGTKIFLQNWDTKLYPNNTIKASFDIVQWMPAYGVTISGFITNSAAIPGTNILVIESIGANFITNGVKSGNVLKNNTTSEYTFVTSVSTESQLFVFNPISGISIGQSFTVYAGVTEDFFLIDCIDWMLYRTIQELNLFLKEDQRVIVSDKMLTEAWNTVVSWNSRLEKHADDLDLE